MITAYSRDISGKYSRSGRICHPGFRVLCYLTYATNMLAFSNSEITMNFFPQDGSLSMCHSNKPVARSRVTQWPFVLFSVNS